MRLALLSRAFISNSTSALLLLYSLLSQSPLHRACTNENRLEKEREVGEAKSQREIDRITKKLNELETKIEDYKKASGIDLDNCGWRHDAKDIGKVVRFIHDGGADAIKEQLLGLEVTAKDVLDRIANGLGVLALTAPEEKQIINPH